MAVLLVSGSAVVKVAQLETSPAAASVAALVVWWVGWLVENLADQMVVMLVGPRDLQMEKYLVFWKGTGKVLEMGD